MSCFHCRFPNLTLLLLPVTHDTKCCVVLPVEFRCKRDTNGNTQPLSKRSARHFNAGKFEPMRMSLKWRPEFSQQHRVFEFAESCKCETHVEGGGFVSRRPNNPVAIFP